MLLGQCRPAGGDGTGHAGLEKSDHVGVALTDDHLAGLDHILFRPVEGVEGAPLRVDRCFGGVLVLGWIAASGQDPAPECHRIARRVADREEDPSPEGILDLAPAVDEPESGTDGYVLAELQRRAQGVPPVRGPPEAESADHFAVVAPAAQVVTGCYGVCSGQKAVVVPLGGLFHRL